MNKHTLESINLNISRTWLEPIVGTSECLFVLSATTKRTSEHESYKEDYLLLQL
jgi:hypothetical protein